MRRGDCAQAPLEAAGLEATICAGGQVAAECFLAGRHRWRSAVVAPRLELAKVRAITSQGRFRAALADILFAARRLGRHRQGLDLRPSTNNSDPRHSLA